MKIWGKHVGVAIASIWFLVIANGVKAQEEMFSTEVKTQEAVLSNVPFVSDSKTRATNEIIFRINYKARDALARLSPRLKDAVSEVEIEEEVIHFFNGQQPVRQSLVGSETSARFLIEQNRLSDSERDANESARFRGEIPPDAYDPRLNLNQYIVVRASSIDEAAKLAEYLRANGVVQYVGVNALTSLSATPTDSFFSPMSSGTPAGHYQWGMHVMNFPGAWDITKGHAYVGVMDAGWPGVATSAGTFTPHPDLANSFRSRMVSIPYAPTPIATTTNHTVHVTGIIGAQHSNGHGVAGGCPNCSVVPYPFNSGSAPTEAKVTASINLAIDGGMQVLNYSGGVDYGSCGAQPTMCDALNLAMHHGMLVVVASGNDRNIITPAGSPQFPGWLGDSYPVLPVGGIDISWSRWDTGLPSGGNCPNAFKQCELGSNDVSTSGVMAPAVHIVSTFNAGQEFSDLAQSSCSDNPTLDQSYGRFLFNNDGFGTCTGTSMAAPFITSTAALIRSVYPRASVHEVRQRIRAAGTFAAAPNVAIGSGIVNASAAVASTISVHNPYRLTPLYAYYSDARKDSFYTTKPQMARAAIRGTMLPKVAGTSVASNKYDQSYGSPTTGPLVPGGSPFSVGGIDASSAEVWIFTTNLNPANSSVPLTPLVRMSWRCGDSLPAPAVCSTSPSHVDTVLVTDSELATFEGWGYRVDGIEGYVYPVSQAQPAGTVRLVKRYNSARDDHAVFPEYMLSYMAYLGYTATSGLATLGYVHANPPSGVMPTY